MPGKRTLNHNLTAGAVLKPRATVQEACHRSHVTLFFRIWCHISYFQAAQANANRTSAAKSPTGKQLGRMTCELGNGNEDTVE